MIKDRPLAIAGFLVLMAAGSGVAQETLVCDVDQVAAPCIECLVEVEEAGRAGICYAKALPEPLSSGLGESCPDGLDAYEVTAERIVSSIRNIKVANATLAAGLLPFERSGGDCLLLPDSVRGLSSGAPSEAWSVEANIVGDMQSCIAGDLERIYKLVEELVLGTRLTAERIRRLQDVDIALTRISIEMEAELERAASLRAAAEGYSRICNT